MFYSISDIYINLTYQDNYPTTNLEAIACGTPVVTYNTGGSPESTDKNSVVDVGDLEGIIKLLKDNAVKGSEIDVSKETILKKYRIMYTKMSGAENG